MKYWGYFVSKLLVAGVVFSGIGIGLTKLLPERTTFGDFTSEPWQDLPWTFAFMLFGLTFLGALTLVVIDQRFRCRTCLRRLRMPVGAGAWDKIFRLGSPQTEWICPFGHGTLRVFEIHFTGHMSDAWRPHDDNIWRELETLSTTSKD